MKQYDFDVIVIGGSYAGLSAALSLGRALRNVLVIDANEPCNRFTQVAHNFLAHDGDSPRVVADMGKKQLQKYDTVHFINDYALKGIFTSTGYAITTKSSTTYSAQKLIFATGLRDELDEIKGLRECWGKSVLHCPYCHGYESQGQKTGIIGNGDLGFEHVRTVSQWSRDLTVITNGISDFSHEQWEALKRNKILIIEKKIEKLEHNDGQVKAVCFDDGSRFDAKVLYTKPKHTQQTGIPSDLGCSISDTGLLDVDAFQRTTIPGIYACGDNSTFGRSIAVAVQTGSVAGVFCNKELTDQAF